MVRWYLAFRTNAVLIFIGDKGQTKMVLPIHIYIMEDNGGWFYHENGERYTFETLWRQKVVLTSKHR